MKIVQKTVQALLNELFLIDQHNKESILKEYIKENNVKFDKSKIMYNSLILIK